MSEIRELILSPTQAETFNRCQRCWIFEKVWRLPTPPQEHFELGTVLHAVLERWLRADELGRVNGKPVELYPKGWEGSLVPAQASLVKYLVSVGISEGIIERWPQRRIEHSFKIKLGEHSGIRISVMGVIDVLLPDTVIDHKTVKTFKYAKSKEALANNLQVLTYALVPMFETERRGAVAPREVWVRHNVFCKVPAIPDEVLGRILQGEHVPVDPARVVRKVEATVSQEAVLQNATRLLTMGQEMIDLRLWVHDKQPQWHELPGPEDKSQACNAYGGCSFRSICGRKETVKRYTQRIRRLTESKVDFPTEKSRIQETQTVSTFQDAMKQLQSTKAAIASKPSASNQAVGVNPPAPAQPEMPAPETLQQALDPAPWANPGCKACSGLGFNTKGSPCRICDATDPASSWFVFERLEDGTLAFEVLPEYAERWEKMNVPPTPAAPDPSPAPSEPVPAPAAPDPLQSLEKTEDVEKPSRGRPKLSFTLILGGVAVSKFPKTKNLISLADVLAEWGAKLAQHQGAESYYALDAFKRRDALAQIAEQIADELGSDYVMADGESPDLRSLADVLKPFATVIVGG